MVLVNNPGTWRTVYPPLLHADWHGWTFTDVVFPFFVFIVGVAVPIALGPRARRSGRARTMARVVQRSVVIFALGIILNALPAFDWATLRIPGVLQRIAVCYLVAGLLFLLTSWRVQALIAAWLLVGYWIVMTTVPVPGYGAGDLSKAGNLAAYLDRTILGPHLWQAARVYDPEGILSTVPAVATALLGVLAGHWLRRKDKSGATASRVALAGIACAGVGQVWDLWFPVNKALWTSSYAILMGGFALIALAACYWLIEVRGYRRWAVPFAALGVNALALFFLSTLLAKLLILVRVGTENATLHALLFDRLFAPWASSVNASLAFAVTYVLLWWAIMGLLYRWNIQLRV
jgi:predicted acyltransferase